MMRKSFLAALAVLFLPPCFAIAQEPKPIYPPDAATMTAIQQKIKELEAATVRLRREDDLQISFGTRGEPVFSWSPLAEVFLKAARWTVKHNEFWQKDSAKQTLAVLDEGLRRTRDFAAFRKSMSELGGRTVACGYRSEIDDSVQPYVASFPVEFGKDPKRKWRLDIVLHGRDNTLTEVKMLAGALKRRQIKPNQDFIQLDVFGRGNNAFRWAGETDVYEAWQALEDLTTKISPDRESRIDPDRVVLRGFSMGGAGAWHMGLHSPDKWCVIGPGAGFTRTHGYIKNLPAKLPDYQEACLRIYDAVDYAENAAMVPVVAYAGDKDAQQQAAINIENILKPLGIPMTRLVGTGLAHQFPPEWQRKAQEAYAPFVKRGRKVNAKKIHFVTYTLSYPGCDWVQLLRLERHYERTVIDAQITDDGYDIKTSNVRDFMILVPPAIRTRTNHLICIDGQKISLRPLPGMSSGWSALLLTKTNGVWEDGPGKVHAAKNRLVHGPIDDAFRTKFVCVRGTGQSANPRIQAYADAALARFRREWELHFRSELPVITDKQYLAEKEAARPKGFFDSRRSTQFANSIVLFGDPSSNAAIADLLSNEKARLPIQWDAKELKFGSRTYAAESHLPVFVYPNSPYADGYVVVNSGHTFHEADLKGTNALLYPRLGDFAVLKPTPTELDPAAAEVVRAGLFDEEWKVPAEK